MEQTLMCKLAFLLIFTYAEARIFCEKTKVPLEVGMWQPDLKRMDSTVVQIRPLSISEGQIYVYENRFPGYVIEYIHVDNLAIRSCGAGASMVSGGVGTSSVLIVLHANMNQEIRSVIEIWGVKDYEKAKSSPQTEDFKNMKSMYMFNQLRAVNHNAAY